MHVLELSNLRQTIDIESTIREDIDRFYGRRILILNAL